MDRGKRAEEDTLGQPMHRNAARAFTSGIKTGYDLPPYVQHLCVGVDAKTGHHVMQRRRRPGSIERWRFYLVGGRWLAEVRIHTRVNKGVVSGHRGAECFSRHCPPLVRATLHVARQFLERIRLKEEPAILIDDRFVKS